MDLTYDPKTTERVNYMERRYFKAAVLTMIRKDYRGGQTEIRRLPLRFNAMVGKVYGGVGALREEWKKARRERGEKLSIEELASMEGTLTGYLAGKYKMEKNFDFLALTDSKRRELGISEEWSHLFLSYYEPAYRKGLKFSSSTEERTICKLLTDSETAVAGELSEEERAVLRDMAGALAE